jgi:hypothetical protein
MTYLKVKMTFKKVNRNLYLVGLIIKKRAQAYEKVNKIF